MEKEYKPEPAMHCSPQEFDLLSKKAHKVLEKGMYVHTTEFPDIPEDELVFKDNLLKFDGYIKTSKGNADNTQLRNKYAVIVYKHMTSDLKYAKLICKNDVTLIQLSGFDSSYAPEPATIPLTRNIKDIVKGPEQGMVHVILEKPEGTKKQRKERKTYIVRVYLTLDGTEYTDGCYSTDSRKLFPTNIPKDVPRYYQILIKNSAGINEMAPRFKFTLS
ncbi:MAG: hypothetical protein WCL06_00460 [Bacteroidota bacterium]